MRIREDSLYRKYAFNDLIKNKTINFTLFVILVLSAFLMATGSMVMERLVGSVDQLFAQAKPPHFLQMHKGDYDQSALEGFAQGRSDLQAWELVEMVGFDSAALSWSRPSSEQSGSMSESLIDNLFVVQNQDFDFLLDESGAVADPGPGEVYVPVAYQQSFDLVLGDVLNVQTDDGIRELQIQGFVRDAQMASSLSSATRFLVSEQDFTALGEAGGGSPEIIVEYRLIDEAGTAALQRDYEADEALPKNGQAVTFQMIRMINAISDGLVAVALVFASLLLVAIALLNVRFVIQGTLEDEVHEIGVMKAIGLPNKAITGLYLAKYSAMTLAACVVGGLLAILGTSLLTRNIQVNYAEAPMGLWTVLVPVLALILVYVFVIVICRRVLGRVRRIQVVSALVHGSTLDEQKTARRAKRLATRARKTQLSAYSGGNLNRRLAWLDLRAEAGQWVLIPILFALAAVLIVLPINVLTTFESPRFVTYMGAPESDLRVDLQFSTDVDELRTEVLSTMENDDRLRDVLVFSNVLYEVEGVEGWETLRIELGDQSGASVEFLEGSKPGDGEIALSSLNAKKLEVSVDGELDIRRGGEDTRVRVSGIYQDVTSGGFTAKMPGQVTAGAASYVIYSDVTDGVDPKVVASEYNESFPAATIIPMKEYVQQTLAYVTDAFRGAAVLSFIFGVGVVVLMTSLFLKLRLARDRRKMGVLAAVGFAMREIIAQIRFKTLLAVVLGTVFGVVFVASTGEYMVGALLRLAGFGIERFGFIPNPLLVYVVCPLALIGAGYLSAVLLTARLHRLDKSTWLRG